VIIEILLHVNFDHILYIVVTFVLYNCSRWNKSTSYSVQSHFKIL